MRNPAADRPGSMIPPTLGAVLVRWTPYYNPGLLYSFVSHPIAAWSILCILAFLDFDGAEIHLLHSTTGIVGKWESRTINGSI